MMNETLLRQLLAENNLELVQSNVGEGGSAYVHQARVREANAQFPTQGAGIAVKEYKAAILKNPGQVLRIRQEAHISKLVSHPSLVKTYGLVAEPAEGESGPYLLAMDWLSDSTLEKWIADPKSPTDWPALRDVMVAIVDAVAALHEKKIYHRDLKPENVAMGADGKPVVMDLGIAERFDDDELTMHTKTNVFIGSIWFASPQFLQKLPFTPKDDVYSLGAILYQIVTGQRVYANDFKWLVGGKIIEKSPRVEALRDGIPPGIKLLVEGSMHQGRDRRPTLAQMKDALLGPEKSEYIAAEENARAKEAREYVILRVEKTNIWADLNGDEPKRNTYKVVRRMPALRVPSTGEAVHPEMWIMDVMFKHSTNGVGHFVKAKSRWIRDSSSKSLWDSFSGGYTEWYEVSSEDVRIGDLIIKTDE